MGYKRCIELIVKQVDINPNHLRILLILKEADKPLATEEIRIILEKEGVYKHRENTHKALQKLVRIGLVKKEKGKNKVGDVYYLA